MAIQISVQSFENFAKEKGGFFQEVYSHCISKVDPNELSMLKIGAKKAKAMLIELNPKLAAKLAFGNDPFLQTKEVFEELSSDQIGNWITAMVEKEESTWPKFIPNFFKPFLEAYRDTSMDKIFEIDYRALKSAGEKECLGAMWLVFAATLTISDSEAVGSLFDS
jgi:hypothetical protein